MGSSIRRQLWEAATGLTAGAGLGLLYELLRPLLGSRRRLLRLSFSLGYLLLAFVWIFLAGQLGGRGGAPLYLLICAAGWLLTHGLFRAIRRGLAGEASPNKPRITQDLQKMPVFRDKLEKKHRKKF